MKRITYILILLLAALFLLAGCAGQSPAATSAAPAAATVHKIDVQQLNTMLGNKDFVFVNVHIPFEGDIAGTDVSIPYNEIARHLDQLPAKDAKIVLYCRSGRMSNEASQTLLNLGYSNVYDVEGGMVAWQQAGYPLLTK